MKKIILTILSLLVFFCVLNLSTYAETLASQPPIWVDGSGGTIRNLAELRWLSETPIAWNETWSLGSNINASETKEWNIVENVALGFSPIGDYRYGSRSRIEFTGTFNGNGYSIDSLYINRPTENYVGFFGCLASASVKNLSLTHISIKGNENVGALSGYSSGTKVSLCYVEGNLNGRTNVGGISGTAHYMNTSNCIVSTNIKGIGYVGGFAGTCGYNCTFEYSYSSGKIDGTYNNYGLFGSSYYSVSINSCYYDFNQSGLSYFDTNEPYNPMLETPDFSNEINFPGWNFENIWQISYLNESDTIKRPYFNWLLHKNFISIIPSIGFAGEIRGSGLYNTGDEIELIAEPKFGYNFVGWVYNGKNISQSTNFKCKYDTLTSHMFRAIFYENYAFDSGNGNLYDPYIISNLEQLRYLCNVISLLDKYFVLGADIDASDTKNWNITGSDTLGFAPIGDNILGNRQLSPFKGSFDGDGHVIKNLYINRPEEDYVGLFGSSISARISNVGLVNANIKGNSNVGGIIGESMGSRLYQTFTLGKIEGINKNVGGLIGTGKNSSVSSSYVAAQLKGTTNTGSLVGNNFSTYFLITFYDSTITNKPAFGLGNTSSQVKGFSSADFSIQENFTDWDFINYWEIASIPEIDSIKRPYFKWQFYDYKVDFYSNSNMTYTVTGNGFYKFNDTVIIEITPKKGYKLENCTLDDTIISQENRFEFVGSKRKIYLFNIKITEDYEFAGGDGSINDPYKISTLDQLEYLSNIPSLWNKNFILINDIDASQTNTFNIVNNDTLGFSPIGANNMNIPYSGVFNGNGKTISNLYINRPNTSSIGLLGDCYNASVKNLKLSNIKITGLNAVGGAIGKANNSNISELFIYGTVNGKSNNIGGVIGQIYYCNVTNSNFIGTVKGITSVGGLIGASSSANISNCYTSASIYCTKDSGAIIGNDFDSDVTSCYFDKDKIQNLKGINGIYNADNSTGLSATSFAEQNNFINWNFNNVWEITNNLEIDSIKRPYLKRFRFDYEVITTSNIEDAGQVTGNGLYNKNDKVVLKVSPKAGYVFLGWVLDNDTLPSTDSLSFNINDNYAIELLFKESYNFAGGDGTKTNPYQISEFYHLEILSNITKLWDKHFILNNNINASASRKINILYGDTLGFKPIGGSYDAYKQLKGFNGSFNGNGYFIDSLYVNRKNINYVGLFGYTNYAKIEDLGLTHLYVYGSKYVGGLVGYNKNSNLTDCFTNGIIKGTTSEIGGLVGYNTFSNIKNCYTTALINGLQYTGGLIGMLYYGSITNNFFDLNTCEQSIGIGYNNNGVVNSGLLTTEFSKENKFIDWDFTNKWVIDKIPAIDSASRPYFIKQLYDFRVSLESTLFGGMFYGDGLYKNNDTVIIETKPKTGFEFKCWTHNGDTVSYSKIDTIVSISGFQNSYIAHFEEKYSFAGGDGSVENPFQIATLEQLAYLSNVTSLWNKHFTLISDIDASDTKNWNIIKEDTLGFSPIGDSPNNGFRQKIRFTGTFKGNNHTIDGIYINRPDEDFNGLFGYIENSTIQELNLSNITIKNSHNFSGGLVGYVTGTCNIKNVKISGEIKGEGTIGGLCGQVNGSSVIEFTSSSATIMGLFDNVGGLIGSLSRSSNTHTSQSTCNVKGKSNVGGLVGTSSGTISNSFSISNVVGEANTGGLVGSNAYVGIAIINNSYALLLNNDSLNCGALIGINYISAELNNCYFDKQYNDSLKPIHQNNSNQQVIGLNTLDFKDKNNFNNWDFEDIWTLRKINDNDSVIRPYLNWYYYNSKLTVESKYETVVSQEYVKWCNKGDTIILDAKPRNGYIFNGWTLGSDTISKNANYKFVYNETSNKTIIANYSEYFKFNGGNGSEINPYQIANFEQLATLSTLKSLWNKYFILVSDIDASESHFMNITDSDTLGFSPIGLLSNNNRLDFPFTGKFNGNGYVISNLYINRGEYNNIGLFGYIDAAEIKRVRIDNCSIKGNNDTGGLIGTSVGESSIFYNRVTGNINGIDYVGGLMGSIYGGTVMYNCSYGSVSGRNVVGGLFGYAQWPATISRCFSTDTVVGGSEVGGLIGSCATDLYNSFATGNVIGEIFVGGLVGVSSESIEMCYSTSAVTGEYSSGAFVGHTSWYSEIINCSFDNQRSKLTNGIGENFSNTSVSSLSSSSFQYYDFFRYWNWGSVWELTKRNDIDPYYIRPYHKWMNSYTLEVKNVSNGRITGTLKQLLNHWDYSTPIIAIPNEGYYFKGWNYQNSPRTYSSVNPLVCETLEDNTILYPVFEPKQYIASTHILKGMGTIVVDQNKPRYDSEITITITPHSDYEIQSVFLNGIDVTDEVIENGNQINYKTIVKGNCIFSVSFQIKTTIKAVEESNISIFPNPAKEYVIIKSNHPCDLSIFNLSGIEIKSLNKIKNAQNEVTIDLSNIASGAYMLRIKNRDNIIFKTLIIK